MLKLLKFVLWIVVILCLTIGVDQLMLKVPLDVPGLRETQQFYVDFRSRLIRLTGARTKPVQDQIENVIEQSTSQGTAKQKNGRYLYVDKDGVLQFADNLKAVPLDYRHSAQPMAD